MSVNTISLSRRRLLPAVAALCALVVAGTGCSKTIDTKELEASLKSKLAKSAGVEPKSVVCPKDIEARKGKKFDCTVTAPNGDEVKVNVTLTNDKGGYSASVPPQ